MPEIFGEKWNLKKGESIPNNFNDKDLVWIPNDIHNIGTYVHGKWQQ